MREDTRDKVCVFISSSDNTKDVFFYTYQAFTKYWGHCPYDIFIGTNTSIFYIKDSFHQIYCENLKNWRSELFIQIQKLPKQYEFVILFLDDFFLKKEVNNILVERLVEEAIQSNADYTRFIPRLTSAFGMLIRNLYISDKYFERINRTEPYYSSLQVSIWKREYLTIRLATSGSIWDFEHEVSNAVHQAVVKSKPFKYIHIVEKGKWNFYAKSVINRAGLSFYPGNRNILGYAYALHYYFKEIAFMIVGYSFIKIKSRIFEILNYNSRL